MKTIPLKKDELIGRFVKIKNCTDPTMIQMEGIIIDETQQMLLIETSKRKRWIAKENSTFLFPSKMNHEIKGSTIRFRPEERIKKAR